jgi:hypothetical protein
MSAITALLNDLFNFISAFNICSAIVLVALAVRVVLAKPTTADGSNHGPRRLIWWPPFRAWVWVTVILASIYTVHKLVVFGYGPLSTGYTRPTEELVRSCVEGITLLAAIRLILAVLRSEDT